MTDTSRGKRFALELDEAILRYGLSLRDIADRLAAAGTPCTAANLSYWRNGRSFPRRRNSLAVVDELERVLELPTGHLRAALERDIGPQPDSEAKPVAVRSESPTTLRRASLVHNTDTEVSTNFAGVDGMVHWEHEVVREVMEEDITISADFRTVDMKMMLVVRPVVEDSTLHMTGLWDEGHPPADGDIGLYNVLGARIGKTVSDTTPAGVVRVTTLHMPEDIKPGEPHHVCFERRFWSDEPRKYAIKRAFSWPYRFYVCRVTFEGEVPEGIEWSLSSTRGVHGGGVERTILSRPLHPYGHTVMATMEHVSNAVGAIRWR